MTLDKTVIPVTKGKSSSTPEGRNALGRFTKGNPYGGQSPGAPRQELVRRFRELLYDMTAAEEIAEIWLAVMKKAKKGNLTAARLIFQYTLGDPDKFISVDYSGGVELVWDWDKVTLSPGAPVSPNLPAEDVIDLVAEDDNDK